MFKTIGNQIHKTPWWGLLLGGITTQAKAQETYKIGASLGLSGYIASIVVGLVTSRRRGHRLTVSALFMPLYWLLISLAAYRALWQLYWDPYLWEKTPHGLAEED